MKQLFSMKILKNIKKERIRFCKFLIVGVINTSITYIVYVLLRLFNIAPELCNIIGYAAGVINSFIWNKKWVFQTKGSNICREMTFFFLIFIFCFFIQFYVFRFVLYQLKWNEYLSQFIGMIVYTLLNFTLNITISFKKV